MKKILTLVLLGASVSGWAVLPPIHETNKELKAIFADGAAVTALAEKTVASIDSITNEWAAGGGWVLKAGKCSVRALAVRKQLPPGVIGSAEIERIDLSKVVCR